MQDYPDERNPGSANQGDDLDAILAEIVALTAPPIRQAHQRDSEQLAQETGFTRQHAAKLLNAKVKTGELETGIVYDPIAQRSTRVWWIAENGNKATAD